MTTNTATAFVEGFIGDLGGVGGVGGVEPNLDRLVSDPSGLDAEAMLEAIAHPWFTEPGHQPVALQMMCDFMAPEGSIYFDSIYGDFHGQRAIRNWLVPVMATIDFIEFIPTAPPAIFDEGAGTSSLDEWEMVAVLGDERMPLSRGVSVRRYRDGWITWACDVYDTGVFRVPPPPEAGLEAAPIPDWPRTNWQRDVTGAEIVLQSLDLERAASRLHPTDAVLHDPRVGELRGRDAIASWWAELAGASRGVVLELLGQRLTDGTTSVQEWQQLAVGPDASRTFMTRGTSVRRRTDGLVTYAADYYDTASLDDPEVEAAAHAAGSTLTDDHVARHRMPR